MGGASLAYKLKRRRFSSDLHIHTNYVDGKHSVAECVKKAEENGLELITITEHVRRNLTYDFSKLLQDVYEAREKSGLNVLVGAEAKVIDGEGNLDISPWVREKVDVILACFHSWFGKTAPKKDEYLNALLNMIRKRNADIWAHPFLLAHNHNFHFDATEVLEIIKALKDNGAFFEVNLRYQCPPEPFLTLLINARVPWVIGSDAHCVEEIWHKKRPGFINMESWQNMGGRYEVSTGKSH